MDEAIRWPDLISGIIACLKWTSIFDPYLTWFKPEHRRHVSRSETTSHWLTTGLAESWYASLLHKLLSKSLCKMFFFSINSRTSPHISLIRINKTIYAKCWYLLAPQILVTRYCHTTIYWNMVHTAYNIVTQLSTETWYA